MKKYLVPFLLAIFLLSMPGYSQNRAVKFYEKPWAEVLLMAQQENKLIFMDAYAVWCGPCKWMAANIFTNDTVADYFNANFICAKYDMEKGEGLELRSKYAVKAYPTLLFINAQGEMVHKRVGAPRKVSEYISMGQTATTPGEGLADLTKKYNEGNREPAFLMKYLDCLQGAYTPTREVLASYFAGISDQDLASAANWKLIYRYTDDMNAREFKYLVKNQQQFAKLHTPDSVDQKISEVFMQALVTQVRSKSFNEEYYNQVKAQIRESGFAGAEKVIFASDLNLYLIKMQSDKFYELVFNDLTRYFNDDADMLNSIAWQVFTMTDDKKYLEKAGEWAKRSIEIDSQAFNNDTYANILFKLGHHDKALEYAQTALDLAKREKLPLTDYEDFLKKVQSAVQSPE
jgi:thiol-disulfide isomerase/thioredoxin